MMLRRNLIYTGITRGKRLVVIVGQKRALAMAVRTSDEGKRWSKLREWLGGIADEGIPADGGVRSGLCRSTP